MIESVILGILRSYGIILLKMIHIGSMVEEKELEDFDAPQYKKRGTLFRTPHLYPAPVPSVRPSVCYVIDSYKIT